LQLAELQRHFWSAVRTRGAPPPGVEKWLTASKRQSPAARLAVYHLAYWQRQVTALVSTFPHLQAALGATACERLMLAYIEARPSTEPCIEWLGRDFVEFLALRHTPPHALGIARLEWAQVESLLAPDSHDVVELPRGLGPVFAACRLELVPSLRVEHVARSSFSAFAPSLCEAFPVDESATIDVAFYRPRFAVKHVALAPDEARAYALARDGASIGLICAAFADLSPTEAPPRAMQVLSQWFARGWVARCQP
jgi:Putative DNA-binding domain